MVVRYKSTRADIWRAYWHLWRYSKRMQLATFLTFALVQMSVLTWSATPELSGWDVIASVVCGGGAVCGMAAFPQRWFKPGERVLKIRPTGISTTIGDLSGDIDWTDIARITTTRRYLYIVGTNGNCFGIPQSAFAEDAERHEFEERAIGWWDSRAREKKASS